MSQGSGIRSNTAEEEFPFLKYLLNPLSLTGSASVIKKQSSSSMLSQSFDSCISPKFSLCLLE